MEISDRLDHRNLRALTGIAASMGVAWLFLEYQLRGGHGQVQLLIPLVVAIGLGGLFLGLAVRARVSMRGELAVNSELTWVVILAVSLLPAIMLVIYVVVCVLSVGVVGLLWLLFILGFIVTCAVQLALWLGPFAVIKVVDDEVEENTPVAVGVAVAFYLGVVTLLGKWIGGTFVAAWDCSLPAWFAELRNRIPGWMFIFDSFREALAGLNHDRLISVLLSIASGLAVALACALSVRWVRQRLMVRSTLRPYLPLAAAPIPDEVPMLDQTILLPVVAYVLGTWTVIMSVVVL